MKHFFKTLSILEKGVLMLAFIGLVSTTLVAADAMLEMGQEKEGEGETLTVAMQRTALVQNDSMPAQLPTPMVEEADGTMRVHPKLTMMRGMSKEEVLTHFQSIVSDASASEELKVFAQSRLDFIEHSNVKKTGSVEAQASQPIEPELPVFQQTHPTHSGLGQ